MKMVSEYSLSSAILMKEEKKKGEKKGEEEGGFFIIIIIFTEMDVSECWLHECCDPQFYLFDLQIFFLPMVILTLPF